MGVSAIPSLGGEVPKTGVMGAAMPQPDPALVAFAEEANGYRGALLRVARRHLWDSAVAEDVVQNVLISLLQNKLHGYKKQRPLRPYLMRCVKNECSRVRRKVAVLRHGLRITTSTEIPDDRASSQPDHDLIEQDQTTRIKSALGKLCEPERLAIIECDLWGRSISEVASSLGMTSNYVKVTRYRARLRLRQLLG